MTGFGGQFVAIFFLFFSSICVFWLCSLTDTAAVLQPIKFELNFPIDLRIPLWNQPALSGAQQERSISESTQFSGENTREREIERERARRKKVG